MKSVLITGGTGSFGQACVSRLLTLDIERIVIYSRGEHAQEEMARGLKEHESRLRFFIGDVRDKGRLEFALRGVDTVIHAAALKIVPIAEYNPTECIDTNVGGAKNVVTAAIRSGCKRVVALSTDKAVNPVNLYGASKLAAEKIFIAANALAAGETCFSVVRYGNVVGSRGSVVPLFKRLAAEGKNLPITDVKMTRFWIAMDQSIDLVMLAIDKDSHGVIYIPKIPSIRITDLAEAIAPGKPCNIVGIRPGEKLHECLLTEDEARYTDEIGNYFVITQSLQTAMQTGFRYTSDGNSQWLSVEDLRMMVS